MPSPKISKKESTYIADVIKKGVHFLSAPFVKFFDPEDAPHTSAPCPPQASQADIADDWTPSTKQHVANILASRVRDFKCAAFMFSL